MDPALIAFIGTFGGAFLLKGVEHMFNKKKKNVEKTSEEIIAREVLAALEAAPEEPDWTNKDWVADVHRRQYDEVKQLGKSVTDCHCRECNREKERKKRREQELIWAREKAERKAKLEKEKAEKYRAWKATRPSEERVWSKGAYDFKVPRNMVPEYAHLVLLPPSDPFAEPKFCKGQFSWKDPVTGGMKFVTAMGIERDAFKAEYIRRGEEKAEIKSHQEIKKQIEHLNEQIKKASRIPAVKVKK